MTAPEPRPNIQAEKRALRREVLARLRALAPETRRRASAAIHARLFALEAFRRARGVHCFLSLPEEVETAPVLERCAAEGKRVYVPVVWSDQGPEQGRLGVARWSPGLPLVRGPLGVQEPARGLWVSASGEGEGEAVALAEIDLVIVPGVAFDRSGARLGRGKGYYDRFLAQLAARRGWDGPVGVPGPALERRVALAFAVQIVPRVPCEPWDVRMERILSEDEEILTFGRDGR